MSKDDNEIVADIKAGIEKVQRKGLTFTKVECSGCGNVRLRRRIGNTSRGIKYTDDNHKLWYGKKCPDCVRVMQRNLMRRIRNSQLGEAECDFCGKTFSKKRTVHYYCSRRCRSLIRSKK